MKILGIETSCDETGIAIYSQEEGLLADSVYSQTDIHKNFGGVVPELASRDHIQKTLPMIQEVLAKAHLSLKEIEGIAYTKGPGLIGALLVGAAIAKSLAYALNIPALGIHHMEGHLLAPMLEEKKPAFPFIALLVSGGHTMLVKVEDLGHYTLLGESLDDAAGEAFDKTAKLLGLPYPGGPILAKLAEEGDATRFHFPRPMTDRPGLAFSFSGLKTSVLHTTKKFESMNDQLKKDIAASFQAAVIDTLVIKCEAALKQTGASRLVIAGGVSANLLLRKRLNTLANKLNFEVFYPALPFCTDNGAMIAYAGCMRLLKGEREELNIIAQPRWSMMTLHDT